MSLAWTTVPAPRPVDALTLGVTGVGVAAVSFGSDPARLAAAARRLGEPLVEDASRCAEAAAQLVEYLAGGRTEFDVAVDWRLVAGTGERVLRTLHDTVAHGETVTYGELAARSGLGAGHTAARGVGAIMGSNPVPVVVACHRVLAADGVGGFGGGRAVKEWLLALEGVLTPAFDFDAP